MRTFRLGDRELRTQLGLLNHSFAFGALERLEARAFLFSAQPLGFPPGALGFQSTLLCVSLTLLFEDSTLMLVCQPLLAIGELTVNSVLFQPLQALEGEQERVFSE